MRHGQGNKVIERKWSALCGKTFRNRATLSGIGVILTLTRQWLVQSPRCIFRDQWAADRWFKSLCGSSASESSRKLAAEAVVTQHRSGRGSGGSSAFLRAVQTLTRLEGGQNLCSKSKFGQEGGFCNTAVVSASLWQDLVCPPASIFH
jgi:hypothetical protein